MSEQGEQNLGAEAGATGGTGNPIATPATPPVGSEGNVSNVGAEQQGESALTGGTEWFDVLPEDIREVAKGYGSVEALKTALIPPVIPETYTTPEGVKLDESVVAEFAPLARELKLTQEAWDKLVQFDVARRTKEVQTIQAKYEAEMMDGLAAMSLEMGKDKYDGMVGNARTALKAFGDADVVKWLNDTGLTNSPVLVRFLAKVGARLAEDSPRGGTAGGGEGRKIEDVFYPTMRNK